MSLAPPFGAAFLFLAAAALAHSAAVWVVAACVAPESEVVVEGVYTGPARLGYLDVLARMGADVRVDRAEGSITARSSQLQGTVVEPHEIPDVQDEIPVLAVAAACATGPTVVRGAGELRVKESDRLTTVASELGRLGARVEVAGDELTVHGGRLRAGRARSHGDHRVAMAMAVAGLVADGETTVTGWDAVDTSYPGFEDDLATLAHGGQT